MNISHYRSHSSMKVEVRNRFTVSLVSSDGKVCSHTHSGERTESLTVYADWWELVGQSSSFLFVPLASVFLSTYLWPPSCNANTNQHFMCLGAKKWPASGNLTSHELSRPSSCLLPLPDTWALCSSLVGRVVYLNLAFHFTWLFSTPPELQW